MLTDSPLFSIASFVLGALTVCISIVAIWHGVNRQLIYSRPYTLRAASGREKWRWSFVLVCLQVLPVLVLVLLFFFWLSLLYRAPASLMVVRGLNCAALFFTAFGLAILWKRYELERSLNWLYWQDLTRKQQPVYLRAFMRSITLVQGSDEHRRFAEEGFPDGEANKWRVKWASYEMVGWMVIGSLVLILILTSALGWWR